jgi:hypothetical protein
LCEQLTKSRDKYQPRVSLRGIETISEQGGWQNELQVSLGGRVTALMEAVFQTEYAPLPNV